MSIMFWDESNIYSALYQEARRTCGVEKLTTGESTLLFQTSHEFSQFWSHWKLLSFLCISLRWSLLPHDHWSSSALFLPSSPLLPPWSWSFSLVLALALCAHLWDYPCSLAWLEAFLSQYSFLFKTMHGLSIHTQWDNDRISPFLRFFCCKTIAEVPRVRLPSFNSLNAFHTSR